MIPERDKPVKMNPPQYLLLLQASTGALVELRAVNSKDFGLTHGPTELLGTFGLPGGMSVEDFTEKLALLTMVYDRLLPEFAARKPAVAPEIRKTADEFAQLPILDSFKKMSKPQRRMCFKTHLPPLSFDLFLG